MAQIAGALDADISDFLELGATAKANTLLELKQRMVEKGVVSFEKAYKLTKLFGKEAASVYDSNTPLNMVQTLETRGYALLDRQTRATLAEAANNIGHPEWSQMMNNYHQWKEVGKIANSVFADRGGKWGSIHNAILSRFIPQMLVGNLKWIGLGGVGGGIVGAVSPNETVLGGAGKGAIVGGALTGGIYGAEKLAPFAAQSSAQALKALAPETGRAMLQNYLMPEDQEKQVLFGTQ
jgi:hypothetical protein